MQTYVTSKDGYASAKAKAKAKVSVPPQTQGHCEALLPGGKLDCSWMFYKNNNSIGIRLRGGRQIFSFGIGAKTTVTSIRYQALVKLAKQCIIKLLQGEGIDATKTWSQQQVQSIKWLQCNIHIAYMW